jgi:cytochrome c oxidase subunit 3
MRGYRNMITVTAVLGVVFIALQILGFEKIWKSGITFNGSGAGQFLYVIAGLHALHVLGGVIALLVMFLKAFNTRTRNYDSVPIEVASTYWHFVDVLWIYLFIFFLVIH